MAKSLALLPGYVAKNWSRFDHFLEVLLAFGVGTQPQGDKNLEQIEQAKPSEEEEVGLEFLFRNKFIERACDFVLGKKSPLCQVGEKRSEMGGSFSTPNFTPVVKLVTKMV